MTQEKEPGGLPSGQQGKVRAERTTSDLPISPTTSPNQLLRGIPGHGQQEAFQQLRSTGEQLEREDVEKK